MNPDYVTGREGARELKAEGAYKLWLTARLTGSHSLSRLSFEQHNMPQYKVDGIHI